MGCRSLRASVTGAAFCVCAACASPTPELGTDPVGTGATGGGAGNGGIGGSAGGGGSGGTTMNAVVSATCTSQIANVLRADCGISLESEAIATLVFTDPAGEALEFRSSSSATTHALVAWGLLPATKYTWVVAPEGGGGDKSGTLTTGVLPEYADVDPIVTGTAGVEAVAVPFGCGRSDVFVVLDAVGRVRWYEALAGEYDALSGVGFLPDSAGVVGVVNNDRVVEVHMTGEITKDWTMEELGVAKAVHHMAYSAGEILYLVTSEEQEQDGRDIVIDGVIALDMVGTVIHEWTTNDAMDPWSMPAVGFGHNYWAVEFPGAEDLTHLNGIHVDGQNRLTASLLEFDTVIQVDFDPTSPTYLQNLWVLAGGLEIPMGTDFVNTTSVGGELGFTSQHHPTFVDGHLLTLSDNRTPSAAARTLEIEIDESSGTANIVQKHSFGETCPVQGSVFLQDDGSVIATCAAAKTVVQFADGGGDTPQWSMEMKCRDGGISFGIMSEGKPVDLPN